MICRIILSQDLLFENNRITKKYIIRVEEKRQDQENLVLAEKTLFCSTVIENKSNFPDSAIYIWTERFKFDYSGNIDIRISQMRDNMRSQFPGREVETFVDTKGINSCCSNSDESRFMVFKNIYYYR